MLTLERGPAAGTVWVVREHPTEVRWLGALEARRVQDLIDAEQRNRTAVARSRYREVLRSRIVWQLVATYFLWFGATFGVVLWLPTVIKNASPSSSALHVGLLSAIPFVVALIAMLLWGRFGRMSIARNGIAFSLAAAGFAILGGQLIHNGTGQLLLLCVVATGGYMAVGTMLAVPSVMFPEASAGVMVAVMATMGSVGGFAGPCLVGWLSQITGSTLTGFAGLAACFLAASILAWFTIPGGRFPMEAVAVEPNQSLSETGVSKDA